MRYAILDPFKIKTTQGEMQLEAGQVITLSSEKAIRLLNEGKITPIEKVAYKVWSEILQGYLWIVETAQDMHSLRSQGFSEAIYTSDEVQKLKGMTSESLREIHKVKEVFLKSNIEEIKKNADR